MIFCTFFDSNYLSRGLAMYDSLRRCLDDFHLYVFAFDRRCREILERMALPRLTVVPSEELEDEDLLAVKPNRSRAEYLWTCTPSTILHVLRRCAVDHCTYLDADLYFFASPEVLFREMGDRSILITSHRFSPPYRHLLPHGKYCVQYMTFKNDKRGLAALTWWRQACLDWCYDRLEDGKFGDQKYLDDWPQRFAGVHELEHLGGGMAPWNVQQYRVFDDGGGLRGEETATGRTFEVVFYHFHSLRFLRRRRVDLGFYRLSPEVQRRIYRPYLRRVVEIGERIAERFPEVDPHGTVAASWKRSLFAVQRVLTGCYHVHPLADFAGA